MCRGKTWQEPERNQSSFVFHRSLVCRDTTLPTSREKEADDATVRFLTNAIDRFHCSRSYQFLTMECKRFQDDLPNSADCGGQDKVGLLFVLKMACISSRDLALGRAAFTPSQAGRSQFSSPNSLLLVDCLALLLDMVKRTV